MAGPQKISEKNKDFFDQVFQVVRLIPEGRVTSYGAIAKYLGAARGARMVGWAMNASHSRQNVPAHRVVNSQGLLSGKFHFSSETAMQDALEAEGVEVSGDKVQHFKDRFWNPTLELKL